MSNSRPVNITHWPQLAYGKYTKQTAMILIYPHITYNI
jgi:hypothetical protein